MTSRQDPIPTLPPMRPSLRRRQRQLSYRPFLLGIIGIGIVAAVAVAIAVSVRGRRLADESFTRAEQLFESGAFHKAREEYELFCNHYSNDARVHEALREAAQAPDLAAARRGIVERVDAFSSGTGRSDDLTLFLARRA